MRILVVDDVGYVRHYFDRLLTQHRHTVWTASSGFQALEILTLEPSIQVVITDLLMPGMDGMELFREAHKLDRRDATGPVPLPVFYLITALRPSSTTPHRETNLLQKALQMGFAEVLLKPIDNERLVRQLAILENKLLGDDARENLAAGANLAELLHVVDQNIERLLCCEDSEALAELTELMQASLARIQKLTNQLDALPAERSTSREPTVQAVDSHDVPALSPATGLSTALGLAAENGLSMEKQS